MEVGGQHHAPAALPPGKTRYPLYRRLGRPQGRSGRVRKISPLTGIRSPDRPARSESLYRLSYPGPRTQNKDRRNRFSVKVTQMKMHRRRSSVVGRVSRLRVGCPSSRVSLPVRGKVLLLQSVQTGRETHSACCSMGIGGSYHKGKADGALIEVLP